MARNLPIGNEKTTNAVMEVVLRLKIKDAMTTDLTTAGRTDSLRTIQMLMKKRFISGVPIVDDGRLLGMISVNHIMTALDSGYISEPAEKYMAKSLVVLEDDMPLSFAITYFNKYSYHRFPVINKEKKLVGIITSRDILVALLNELNAEIDALENKIVSDRVDLPNSIHRDFSVKKFDFENAGHASFELKKMLKEKNVPQKIIRRASVASYELEINLVIHSDGGRIMFTIDGGKIVIETKDDGPGIPDVSRVLEEGYSTANEWIRSLGFGAGMGLANTKRVSDLFDINSEFGKGTYVKSVISLGKTTMKLSELITVLDYEVVTRPDEEKEILSGYTSDLLSDVMGNATEGSVFITIQAHKNSVAVASQLDLPAIILCNHRPVPSDMVDAAKSVGVAILRSRDNQFTVSYKVYSALHK